MKRFMGIMLAAAAAVAQVGQIGPVLACSCQMEQVLKNHLLQSQLHPPVPLPPPLPPSKAGTPAQS
jgi:hypothetical protein